MVLLVSWLRAKMDLASLVLCSRRMADLAPVEPCSRSLEVAVIASVELRARSSFNPQCPRRMVDLAPVEPCSRSLEVAVIATVVLRARLLVELPAFGKAPPVFPSCWSLVKMAFASVELSSHRMVDLAPVEPCSRPLEATVPSSMEQFPRRTVVHPAFLVPVEPGSRTFESSLLAAVEQRPRHPEVLLAPLAPVELCSRSLEAAVIAAVEQRSRHPLFFQSLIAPVELCSRSLMALVLPVFVPMKQRPRHPDDPHVILAPVEPCSRSPEYATFSSVLQDFRRTAASSVREIVSPGRRTDGLAPSHVSAAPAAGGAVPEFTALFWPRTGGVVELCVARALATLVSLGIHALVQVPMLMDEVEFSTYLLAPFHQVLLFKMVSMAPNIMHSYPKELSGISTASIHLVMRPSSPAHQVLGSYPEGPFLLMPSDPQYDPKALYSIPSAGLNMLLVLFSTLDQSLDPEASNGISSHFVLDSSQPPDLVNHAGYSWFWLAGSSDADAPPTIHDPGASVT